MHQNVILAGPLGLYPDHVKGLQRSSDPLAEI